MSEAGDARIAHHAPSDPARWARLRLTDLAQYHNGVAFKPADWSRDGLRIVRIEQLNNPTGQFDRYTGPVSELNRICDGDLVFSWSATLKVVIWRHGDAVLNQHLFKVVPAEGFDRTFLYFLLDYSMEALGAGSHGSTMKHIKRSELQKFVVDVPGLPTQRKIAAILTSLDTAIEKTEALIEKHQQIKAGLMHDLFTRGVLPNGQLRPLREQAPELYEETSHGWMPRGWEATTLRACLAEGATNGIYKPAHLIGSGALLIGQTALTPDRSVDPELARRAIIEAAELQRFGVYADDILVSRVFATVEGVGQPALVPPLEEPAVFESNMMRFRVNAKLMRPRLLFEWLKTDRCRRHINGRANASNQASVSQAVLYPMVVPVPPLDEQDRMLATVGGCTARIAEDLATLSKQRCLKTGLMQDLLTGKVPVKVAATGVPA